MNSAEILKSTETDNFSQNLLSSDTDLLNKVKQVIELTGCSNDIAVTTLYDSNYNIEIAIDKIFEQTQRTLIGEANKINSDWKEVAKYKKKQSLELCQTDSNIDVKDITETKITNDKSRPVRGTGRGRARFTQNSRNYENVNNKPSSNGNEEINETYGNKNSISRGRGKRSQYRLNSNRGRTKHHMNQDNNVFDGIIDGDSDRILPGESNKWNASYDTCNDWISDNTGKSNDYNDSDKPFENHFEDVSHYNPNSALKMDKYENNLIESCIESVKNDVVLKDDIKNNQLNPIELVAKCSNKVDIFGGYSRTKPPAPSSRVPLEPVKLLTSTGVVSKPVKSGFNFSFGLNFNEYFQSAKSIDSSESFISKIILNQPFDGIVSTNKPNKSSLSIMPQENRPDEFLQSNFSENESQLSSIVTSSNVRISSDKSTVKSKPDMKSGDIFSSSNINQRHIEISDKKLIADPNTNYKISDCVSNNHQSLNTTLLSSPQLCPPPGMSNAHLIQQFQNNPQYLSLLNIPNGSSIFSGCNMSQVNDLADVGASDEGQVQQTFMHAESNKEFNQKSSNSKHNICSVPNSSSVNPSQQVMLPKVSESDNAGAHSSMILSAMTMPNICCIPQVYMNNYASFMPTVPGHSSSSQSTEVTQSPLPNKAIYNLPLNHRNFPLSDEFDELIQNKKFQRPPNYVSNFGAKSQDDALEVEKSTKLANNAQINRQPSQQQNLSSSNRANQHQVQQQSVSNDPRFLAFHHQHSNHSYQNNMFNCVTATGAHPTAHPYAMAHQGGGLQQLHPHLQLMQQQMHNFPQSYQFQEHLMTSMVSNPSSRSNISQGSGSSGNQSRNNRPNNQLWHP